ncbi:MAG: arginine--tRNA ligase, partial [Bdellovibrionia bacterium]
MERFAKQAASLLSATLGFSIAPQELEIPPEPQLGDFAFPCFKLAKQFKKSPVQLAQELAQKLNSTLDQNTNLEVHAVGPYVNFTVPAQSVLSTLLPEILENEGLGNYGMLPKNSRGRWVIEYSSPNVAKPLNIYHLRPTALGAALDRIGQFRGFEVTSINHLGDWGKQYGMLAVAFDRYAVPLSPPPSMRELVDLYVRINLEAQTHPEIEEEARAAFLKLEQGDPKLTAVWKMCVDISLAEFKKAYDRLGVHFDHYWGESFYKDLLHPLLDQLEKQGLLIPSEGAWVVPVADEQGVEMPPCILKKNDGATLYSTRDVAAALYRHEKLNFDRMTYIVGAEQKLHFKQIFAVLKKMGCTWVERCEHVPFGLYRFKDAKMSTRKGNFVTLEEVLGATRARVTELIQQRKEQLGLDLNLSSESLSATAEAVAIGAVVFFDLHTDPIKDVEFDLERVVDFEGETGPYLQYAHTRCISILRKAQELGEQPGPIRFDAELVKALSAPEEILLLKTLGQFPLHLERSLSFAKASQLAHFLIDVTRAFGTFYHQCKVL